MSTVDKSFIRYANPNTEIVATSQAVGEEAGTRQPHATTEAVGEEGGGRIATSQAFGEEGGSQVSQPGATTEAVGEEGGYTQPRITTMSIGEEGGTVGRTGPIVQATTIAAIESLRTSEIPFQAVVHQIADAISKDSFLGNRLSPTKVNELAKALVSPENMPKPAGTVIAEFVATR